MLITSDSQAKKLVKSAVSAITMAIFLVTFTVSSAQANDLEIYQKPTAGKKTLIMMLDTSGSMNGKDGFTTSRLDRLKAGMYAVLNSSDPKLTEVVMGVGNFSSQGDGRTGEILVPSARLGAVGSPQRIAIRDAVAGLTGNGYTPSAHAYAEAAAYLMGTITAGATNPVVSSVPHTTTTTSTTYPILKREKYKATSSTTTINTPVGCSGNGRNRCTGTSTVTTINNSKCDQNKSSPDFTTGIWACRSSQWNTYTGTIPTPPTPASIVVDGVIDGSYSGGTGVTIYYMNDNSQPLVSSVDTTTYTTETNYTLDNDDSGFNQSVASSKDLSVPATPHYLSPLPAVANRATCDGQGIYFLSDGQPNKAGGNSDDTKTIMGAALKTTFTCPTSGGLTDTDDGNGKSGWKCMGAFAQALYNKDTNPSGVSIKTAFVGFGADFSGLASTDVLNACHLGSNLTGDTCSPDSTTTSNRNPTGGYGNGGFYIAATADSVTDSVVNFIHNLGNDTIHPLVTGAATIPIDDLNPNGFQPYAYLRMLEPNPAKPTVLLWRGDVKKYALSGGALVSKGSTTTTILNASGVLVDNTTDLWNASTGDGGKIDQGGAYPNVLMPTTASLNTIRPLFTDVGSVQTDGTLNAVANGANLTAVTAASPLSTNIPALFDGATGTTPLKDFSLTQKLKLINFLGFDVPLDSTSVPTTLTAPASAFLAMGGSIHAQPIQLSYSSTIKADGTLSTALDTQGNVIGRTESVLYGSMEGALHLVNAKTGVEQMAFVPKEILANDNSSAALRVGAQDMSATPQTPAQGVDGPWVADPAYKTIKGATPAASKLVASRMNVYGGLRMGGTSYYGLDLLNLTGDTLTPKLLFRIGPDISDYSQMGQSWSKPVLANVRYNNVITRVMLIGGGYDVGYENPSFIPTGSAAGNTVYMVNATTGALIWHATATDNANLTHSIVARVSAIDRDADGLIDSIYFADLGGQVFRADFNNKYGTSTSKFGARVTRLADLATSTEKTNGTNPRFYEAPTVTIHDQGTETFALVTVASGNRSSPLDVIDVSLGGKGLRNLPVNNVYGIIDRDVARPDLIKLNTAGATYVNTNGNDYAPVTHDLTLSSLQKDPQTNLSGVIGDAFFATSSTDTAVKKNGWYRSLSSTADGIEKADGTFRYSGGFKAFEQQLAITGKLYVPVYDPQGTGVATGDPCDPRVVGETDLQTFCLPYGVCLVKTGTNAGQKDTSMESFSGAKFTSDTTPKNDQVIGGGIRGIALGDNGTAPSGTDGDCKGFTIIGNTSGLGNWNCKRKLVPLRWYEKQPNRSMVQ